MSSFLARITILDQQGGSPDNSLPGQGWGVRPDNSLPGGGGLPPGIATLPVFPFDPTKPDHELPGSGGSPDNSLPRPGKKYVVKWLACHGLILVPDNDLPGSGARPDNSLPSGRPERPDQGLPPSPGRPDQGLPALPVRPDQGLPPTEGTPKLYGG